VTTFYLIRHGERLGDQTLLNGRLPGYSLTPAGRTAAERLAQHLAREPVQYLMSSPMERARETAEPLARVRGLQVEVSEAINEIDAGTWAGKTFPVLDVEDAAWRRYNHFRSGNPIPGGETAMAVQARFVGEMLRLRTRFPDAGVALVSHSDPIKLAIGFFLGVPVDFYNRIEIDLASVSVLTLDDWGARILRLNDRPRGVSE
jgi:probable phosphoglycerate mutase